jgi:alkylation response protein AidB-like acyl-CoA dehydrogenase
MEFGWTEEQEAFRAEVKAFLARELPEDWVSIAAQSPGSRAMTDFSRQFCPKLAAAGLLVPHWPERFGGRDAPAWEHFIIGEAMWEVGEPRGPQYYNVNWIGPTLMKYGTPEQQDLHLNLMTSGNVVWSQGFSEPSAGSDLASLRTRAERKGDRFIINGSKIWTSYAALSDYCFLLARTGEGRGAISVFLLPMNRPGVTVRPIRSVVGDGDLHEVFFDDVEAFPSEILGEESRGWPVIRYALQFERVGIPRYQLASRVLHETVSILRQAGDFGVLARQAAAQAHSACEAARMVVYDVIDKRAKGHPPDSATSIGRYAVVLAENAVANFVLDHRPSLLAGAESKMIETHHRRAIAAGIAAGAAEVQLNLIAREVLGLGVKQ